MIGDSEKVNQNKRIDTKIIILKMYYIKKDLTAYPICTIYPRIAE